MKIPGIIPGIIFLIILALIPGEALATSTTTEPYVSAVNNWNFESWSSSTLPSSWSMVYAGGSRTEYTSLGNYAYEISGDGVTATRGEIVQTVSSWVDLDDGEYVLGAFICVNGRTTGSFDIDVMGLNKVGGISYTSNTGEDEYVWVETSFTIEDETTPYIRIQASGTPNLGSVFRVDGITLARVHSVTVDESKNSTHYIQTFTYSPFSVSTLTTYATKFNLYYEEMRVRGNLDPVVTVDGTPVSAWSKEGIIYADMTGYLSSSHSVSIVATWSNPPSLMSPANAATVNFAYPPKTANVNFIWDNVGGEVTYKLQVAEDSSFSNVVYEIETVDSSATASLGAGTFYWRVACYDSIDEEYGDWSSAYHFTHSSSSSISGTGVAGTVYESLAVGSYKYIPGAVVTLYNDTYTVQTTTGAAGYYELTDLAEGVYYLYAEAKGYDTSTIASFNVSDSEIVIQDIAMQEEPEYFQPHYVRFVLRQPSTLGLVKTPVPGATIIVYEGDGTTQYATQKTGTDGACTFAMSEDVRYRLEIVAGSVEQTEYVTPISTQYEIVLDMAVDSIITDAFYSVVEISVDKEIISSSTAEITINYNDTLDETTVANFYLFLVDPETGNWTSVDGDAYISSPYEKTFTVTNYSGNTYLVYAEIVHETYGSVIKTYSVIFPESVFPYTGKSMAYLAIVVCFFVASMFGKSDVGVACLFTSGFGYIFWNLGCFNSLGSTYNTLIGEGIAIAIFLSIVIIFSEKRSAGGI